MPQSGKLISRHRILGLNSATRRTRQAGGTAAIVPRGTFGELTARNPCPCSTWNTRARSDSHVTRTTLDLTGETAPSKDRTVKPADWTKLNFGGGDPTGPQANLRLVDRRSLSQEPEQPRSLQPTCSPRFGFAPFRGAPASLPDTPRNGWIKPNCRVETWVFAGIGKPAKSALRTYP